MNCRAGDLALIVRGEAVGQMCTCLEFLGDVDATYMYGDMYGKVRNAWRIDRTCPRGGIVVVADADLMPIRPEPDETVVKDYLELES